MTKIEWVKNKNGEQGATWNPVTGCSKVSQGCKNCYAEGIAKRFWGDRKFTDVQCHPERLEQPLKRKKPTTYFVNSMSDLFHPDVPFEFIDMVFDVMEVSVQHTFQILTKRPKRMFEYCEGYRNPGFPNVWLGVSVEDQGTADERVPVLLECPAAVRFVSYEPALGPVDFSKIPRPQHFHQQPLGWDSWWPTQLHWIICGGESGPGARPLHPDWARGVRDQCQAAGVPFFMKQICEKGKKIPFDDLPTDLRIREYPNGV